MMEILSLPRGTNDASNQLVSKQIGSKKGLPLNSLPGWEQIPLNCKLPMLKCPDNQVIFTKNKVGVSYAVRKHEFDTTTSGRIPEYNPLHDSNLRTYFSNERNLKRLRQNGEITQDNDVVCNLKDFNAYREELHKAHLYYVMQAYKQRKQEQHDRKLINHAEELTKCDHQHLGARHNCHEQILARRNTLQAEKHERFVRLANITTARIKSLENVAAMKRSLIEHRKMLNTMRMQTHLHICEDMQRKRLIQIKKQFQLKKDRFKRNMRNLHNKRLDKNDEQLKVSWSVRLDERIAKQKRIQQLRSELDKERTNAIAQHKERYKQKWLRIQRNIKERAKHTSSLVKQPAKPKRLKPEPQKPAICEELMANFEGLVDYKLCEALNASVSMQPNELYDWTQNDPVVKTAQFILNYLLNKYDTDLSEDECVMNVMLGRIKDFIIDAQRYVSFKAQKIICFMLENNTLPMPSTTRKPTRQAQIPDHPRYSHVSFNGMANIIGVATYKVHPFVDVLRTANRRPTPAASLDSLGLVQGVDLDNHIDVCMPHLSRKDVIFMEHYFIKFKRALLVGLDKQIFTAIQCHFDHRIFQIREDLLALDRDFLHKQIAISILSYAVNPLNFESALRLAISVISTELISRLQKTLLRPGLKPSSIVYPSNCGTLEQNYMLCKH